MFLFIFFPTHFFQGPSTDILETFPHDVTLVDKEALLCQFPESASDRNEGRTPNFAQFRMAPSQMTLSDTSYNPSQ